MYVRTYVGDVPVGQLLFKKIGFKFGQKLFKMPAQSQEWTQMSKLLASFYAKNDAGESIEVT